MVATRYASIVERFRAWASDEPTVRAALVVGSQSRTLEPADDWSDLDLVIFADDPERWIVSTEWFARFGTVILSMVEPTAVLDQRERRVLYAGGKDVDFAFFPSTALEFVAHSPEGMAVLGRGFEVLLDKEGRLVPLVTLLPDRSAAPPPLPSEQDYQNDVADFWYHVLWVAKKVRRGEIWAAKMGCDGYLKRLLLRMIEWHTRTRGDGIVDVWHSGRFIDRWAPLDVRARLPATFARYDRADLARGLNATANLYADLARGVAASRGWSYPESAGSSVLSLTEETLNEPSLRV